MKTPSNTFNKHEYLYIQQPAMSIIHHQEISRNIIPFVIAMPDPQWQISTKAPIHQALARGTGGLVGEPRFPALGIPLEPFTLATESSTSMLNRDTEVDYM